MTTDSHPLTWLSGGLLPAGSLARIASYIAEALPQEAVGLLWEQPGTLPGVTPLTNISEDPQHSYQVEVAEMREAFARHSGRDIVTAINEGCSLTLWHSHPSGQVGPSLGDMREKLDGLQYMVISVTPEGLLATLF